MLADYTVGAEVELISYYQATGAGSHAVAVGDCRPGGNGDCDCVGGGSVAASVPVILLWRS